MLRAIKTTLLLATCLFVGQAQAADFPDRPIHVIIPFEAGGSVDAVARLLAEKMKPDLGGQSMVIENRGGAGGLIAFEQVVRAKPDGYTIMLGASSYAIIAAMKELTYDPVKDITPITMVNVGPLVLTVNANSPAKTAKEFFEQLKAKPGTIKLGTPGIGSGSHIAGLLLQQSSGTTMVHVPYKSDGAVIIALLAGDIDVALASGPALTPLLADGKLRALAISSDKPWPSMPDLPTINTVVPGFSQLAWHGVWGPAGIPPEAVNKLNQAYKHALELPDVQARLRADVREPRPTTPQEFGDTVARGVAQYKEVVKAANIKLD